MTLIQLVLLRTLLILKTLSLREQLCVLALLGNSVVIKNVNHLMISSSIVQFKCALCPALSEIEETMKHHVLEMHKDWKKAPKKSEEVKQSPHTNQTWLQDLVGDFDTIIVANLSQRAKDAVATNKSVEVKVI